jgi:hypothetical protein
MVQAMPEDLDIALAPERLDEGTPEERAAFGLFTVRSGQRSLTEGFDHFLDGYRPGPLVSGYHAAEWFAWNWWRLRWEPRSPAPDWAMAHRMTSIGEGYVWPNLTIFSDGVRTALLSSPSSRPDARPFRYVGALPLVIPSTTFESAVDAFVPRIIGRLREKGVDETNLDRLWRDVLAERRDPEIAWRRRLEALLSHDPEAPDNGAVERLMADAVHLGEAIEEVAADSVRTTDVLTADRLIELAESKGHEARPRDAVRLGTGHGVVKRADLPAWRVGADTARALRDQERLGAAPMSNTRLARLAGTHLDAVTMVGDTEAPMAFMLDRDALHARLVLRSRWIAGRRFELARLIGDRLMASGGGLHPATRAYTWRQKAQRAFAAELLAPFEVVDAMLGGDYSVERQQDIADHYDVSPMLINTMLKNHGRIDRDGSEFELDAAAA